MTNERSHLTKKPITDKNGKQTTVHVNDQKGDGSENADRLSSVSTTRSKPHIDQDQQTFLDKCEQLGHDDTFSPYRAKQSTEFPNTLQFNDVHPSDYYKLIESIEDDPKSEEFPDGSIEGVLLDSEFRGVLINDESEGDSCEVTLYARDTYTNPQESHYTVFVTNDADTKDHWSELYSEELDRIEE